MKLGEFIKSFSHNNMIRLHYDMESGTKCVLGDWNNVSMDHEILKGKGKNRHYINNEVLRLVGINFQAAHTSYPEALNIVIEYLENQPIVDEVVDGIDVMFNEIEISTNKQLERLKAHLDSPEGKASMSAWVKKYANGIEVKDRWVEKIKLYYGQNIDVLTEKLMDKYYSDEYRDREYFKCKCEPRETLLWLLLDYAESYGTSCEDEKYFNDFTADAYQIGSYVIQLMIGQGSCVRIDKVE
jgi:hypothetical protein